MTSHQVSPEGTPSPTPPARHCTVHDEFTLGCDWCTDVANTPPPTLEHAVRMVLDAIAEYAGQGFPLLGMSLGPELTVLADALADGELERVEMTRTILTAVRRLEADLARLAAVPAPPPPVPANHVTLPYVDLAAILHHAPKAELDTPLGWAQARARMALLNLGESAETDPYEGIANPLLVDRDDVFVALGYATTSRAASAFGSSHPDDQAVRRLLDAAREA